MAGIRLWNAIHSENWRAREAAVVAYANFLNKLPPKYSKDTKKLFQATVDLAKIALEDPLLQISNKGLELLMQATDARICGPDILPKNIIVQLKPFGKILIDRA